MTDKAATAVPAAAIDASIFLGKWEMTSSQNLDKFFDEVGSEFPQNEKFTIDVGKLNTDHWTLIVSTSRSATSYIFTPGLPFDYLTSKLCVSIEGNKMIQVESWIEDDEEIKKISTRVFDGDSMTTTIQQDGIDINPTLTFKRVI